MRSKALFVLLVVLCLCPVSAGADEQPQQEKADPFTGAPADAVWTIIAFLVLLVVLWKFAWKPLLAALNSRQEYIEKQITDAEEKRKEAQGVLAEYKDELANVEDEGKRIIARRVKESEQQAKEMADEARDKREKMKLKAEADIERARNEAQAQLLARSGEIVLKLGEQVLGRTIDDQDNQRLIDEAIERLKNEEGAK